nr:MAG TPA_asm: hypothetical protein [Caudoviricetes sp.]
MRWECEDSWLSSHLNRCDLRCFCAIYGCNSINR